MSNYYGNSVVPRLYDPDVPLEERVRMEEEEQYWTELCERAYQPLTAAQQALVDRLIAEAEQWSKKENGNAD